MDQQSFFTKRRLLFVIFAVLNLLLYQNCGGFKSSQSANSSFSEDSVNFVQFQAVINKNCVSCHGASDSPFPNLINFQLSSAQQWLDLPTRMIVPGEPQNSPVYYRLTRAVNTTEGPANMPLEYPNIEVTMTQAEADIVSQFISDIGNIPTSELSLDSGKLSYALSEARTHISEIHTNHSQVTLLPIQPMIQRLENFVGAGQQGLLSSLRANQQQLGDYNFAAGTPENLAMTPQQNRLWMEGIAPVCASSQIKQRYPWPQGFNQFVRDALGRSSNSTDQGVINQIGQINESGENRFELACLTVLGSLEFRASALRDNSANSSLRSYLNNLKVSLIGESLDASEISRVTSEGVPAVSSIVSSWTQSANFAGSAKRLVDRVLQVSGQLDGINYNLPGNLAQYLVRNDLPFGDILTADYCVDNSGNQINCDTGAPINAGLFTTKAFLTTYRGVFNISRAGGMMQLLCSEYPLPENKEPRLARDELIDFFATNSGQVEFGNGNNCYSCHAQMGLHAQFFVQFDVDGNFRANATGLPSSDTEAIDGFSENGLFQSHLNDATRSSQPISRVFGRSVSSLQEGGQVISRRPEFLRCMTRHLVGKTLRLGDVAQEEINDIALEYLIDKVLVSNGNPTYTDLVLAVFTDPDLIANITNQ